MKKFIYPLLIIGLSSILYATSYAQSSAPFNPKAAHYLWPTNASSYLTSTFAETRAGHFHAALDLKTWGQRGYKVFATRDGIVYRIAIGPTGYGKVIYLKHDDGSYSIYAHLLAFNKQLQQLADSMRFADDYAFQIDRLIDSDSIRVKQGDVIGYSGASGIGPPHLHFELRTPDDKPFNPLLTNLSVHDNIPPTISDLSIEPLSPSSTIEGQNRIFTKHTSIKKGRYDAGVINVSGQVGLGIRVFDQANRVHNVYAVYKMKLTVDGKELFKAEADSFSYKNTDQMNIDRVYPLLNNDGEAFQRLFVADGNSLSFYTTTPQKGKLDLSEGVHKILITATDYFGNSSKLSLRLRVKNNAINHRIPTRSKRKSANIDFTKPEDWHWFKKWVNIPLATFQELTVLPPDTTLFSVHSGTVSMSLNNQEKQFINSDETGPLLFRRLLPDTQQFLSSADYKSFAVFPAHTFYDTVSAAMRVENIKSDSIRLNIIPEAYPLHKKYKFYIQNNDSLNAHSKLSFYHRDQRHKEWDLVPTEFNSDYIISETGYTGKFAMIRDTLPPEIGEPKAVQRPDGKWLLMIHADDDLSGINYHQTKIAVNGIRGIAEYEPEDDRFVYYRPDFTPADTMKVTVTAFDKMGNKAKSTFSIE